MKPFKYIIIVLLLITCFTKNISAQDVLSISGETITVSKGTSQIDYAINIENNPGIAGYTMTLKYPKEFFSVSLDEDDKPIYSKGTFSSKGSYELNDDASKGKIKLIWYNSSNVSSDGSLIKIRFDVDENIDEGEYLFELSISKSKVADEEGTSVSFNVTDGLVVIDKFEPTIYSNDVNVKAGSEFDYIVKLADNPGVASYTLDVIFDDNMFEIVDEDNAVEQINGSGFFDYTINENRITIIQADSQNSYDEGDLFLLHLMAKEKGYGKNKITILKNDNNPIINENYEEVDFDIVSGYVSIYGGIFDITYHLNDGENNTNNPSTYDGTQKIDLLDASKDNSVFLGWYIDEDYINKKTSIEIGEYGDLNLYANFRTNEYNITYHNDDKTYTQNGLISGDDYSLVNIDTIGFTNKDYNFLAWIDTEGNQYLDGAMINPVVEDGETIDLYAIWTQDIDPNGQIIGATISTNGTMEINFYVELGDVDIDNYVNDYQIKVTSNGKDNIVYPNINSIKYVKNKDNENIPTFTITYSLTPKEITQSLAVQLLKKDIDESFIEYGDVIHYSIQTYYDNMLKYGSGAMKDIAAASLNYGSYAQIYFNYDYDSDATKLANYKLDEKYFGDYLDLSKAQKPDPVIYAVRNQEGLSSITGLSFLGNSIVLKSDIRIRYYFMYDDNLDNIIISCADKKIEEIKLAKNNNGYYVELCNITAIDLDKTFEVQIIDKDSNKVSMKYSVFNYILNKYDDVDVNLSNLIKSLYLYNKAAKAKIGED